MNYEKIYGFLSTYFHNMDLSKMEKSLFEFDDNNVYEEEKLNIIFSRICKNRELYLKKMLNVKVFIILIKCGTGTRILRIWKEFTSLKDLERKKFKSTIFKLLNGGGNK